MNKSEKLRKLFLKGVTGTQQELAKILKVPTYQVRSYVCALRKQNWAIINYPIPGSNRTKYGLAVSTTKPKEAQNKTHFSLPVQRGRFVYTMID